MYQNPSYNQNTSGYPGYNYNVPGYPGYGYQTGHSSNDSPKRQTTAASFLGPRAENAEALQRAFMDVLQNQFKHRQNQFPEDKVFATRGMQGPAYQQQMSKMGAGMEALAEALGKSSVPFFSQRYQGHGPAFETSLPAILAYSLSMLYNHNNVSVEASPVTDIIEMGVGQDLCEMLGYNTSNKEDPNPWGSLAPDAMAANTQALLAARNLKYYPLSLWMAMQDGKFGSVSDTFEMRKPDGTTKLFRDLNTWELLNIAPRDIMEIPDGLYSQYNLTSAFVQDLLDDYLVQNPNRPRDLFEERFGRENLKTVFIMAAPSHYSFSKNAAMMGLDSSEIQVVETDENGRMQLNKLKERLEQCAENKTAVGAVFANFGSAFEGACDPIDEIVEIRDNFSGKGLPFTVHCNAEWGGYFPSMLKSASISGSDSAPIIALKPEVEVSLRSLKLCDSVTVDPSKSGFIPGSLGGLLYRDGRMRIFNETKPINGAAASAAWFSHKTIGLDENGYGAMLSEAIINSKLMYANLATLSSKSDNFETVTFSRLPSEIKGEDVEREKQFVRQRIVGVPQDTIITDKDALRLLQAMGPDLLKNNFACNFKVNGKLNTNVAAANDLNRRIYERLSLSSPSSKASEIPLFLSSTQLSQKAYGDALSAYKKRLGLEPSDDDLIVLSTFSNSPFPSNPDLMRQMMKDLRRVIEEETATSVEWNTLSPDTHTFIMQGTDKLYLSYLPMFNKKNHRQQVIISGDLPPREMSQYISARNQDPSQVYTLSNVKPELLSTMLDRGSFTVNMNKGFGPDSKRFLSNVPLSNVRVIENRGLDGSEFIKLEDASDLVGARYYVVGAPQGQMHLDHVLMGPRSVQLHSHQVQLSTPIDFDGYAIAHMKNIPERSLRYYSNDATIKQDPKFFFKPGASFPVTITRDLEGKFVLGEGTLTLGKSTYVGLDDLNRLPASGGPKGAMESSYPVSTGYGTAWSGPYYSSQGSYHSYPPTHGWTDSKTLSDAGSKLGSFHYGL